MYQRALTSLHHAVRLGDWGRAAYALARLRDLNEREDDIVVAREMATLDAELGETD